MEKLQGYFLSALVALTPLGSLMLEKGVLTWRSIGSPKTSQMVFSLLQRLSTASPLDVESRLSQLSLMTTRFLARAAKDTNTGEFLFSGDLTENKKKHDATKNTAESMSAKAASKTAAAKRLSV